MKETFMLIKKEEAIKLLEESNSEYVMVLNMSSTKKINKSEGEKLINDAKSIIYSCDEMMTNLDLYSCLQPDVYNIKRSGYINSMLLLMNGGVKLDE